jgi:hypothetical protein
MARCFRESYAVMTGTVFGAILDQLMNEVALDPETWPFMVDGCVRIACSRGDTSPAFLLLFGLTDSTITFLEVNISESLGAWGTETRGEISH